MYGQTNTHTDICIDGWSLYKSTINIFQKGWVYSYLTLMTESKAISHFIREQAINIHCWQNIFRWFQTLEIWLDCTKKSANVIIVNK